MRKGRLELWLGASCVGLVLAVGLGGLYHRRIQAMYYRWRFLHGEKTAAAEAARRMVALGPEGESRLRGLVIEDPENDLSVLVQQELTVTVRNDRPHRVYVGSPGGTELLAHLGGPLTPERRETYIRAARWLAQRSDGSGGGNAEIQAALAWLAAHVETDPRIVTPHRVLDPGEAAEFWVSPAR